MLDNIFVSKDKHIIQWWLKFGGVCKIMFKKCLAVATIDHSTSERWTAVKEVTVQFSRIYAVIKKSERYNVHDKGQMSVAVERWTAAKDPSDCAIQQNCQFQHSSVMLALYIHAQI